MNTQDLRGKQIVITGGTGALGMAVVSHLVQRGAMCHVTYVLADEAERMREMQQVRLHDVDCTSDESVVRFYSGLTRVDGSIHIVGGFAMAPITETSLTLFRRMLDLNLISSFLCCREAIKKMRQHGEGGHIVNVAARPAVQPVGGMVAYSTAKAAVASLTQCAAEETKAEGILVNAVLPSIMDTPANRAAMPTADFTTWPKVEEVAAAIGYLASGNNRLTTGTLLPVYGRA